ncbi:hypothetical protein CROQUDRAFT_662378 [Cronartium quercuum f. sp. fusiforme G11]|uniref:Uncharacterized protein n=1 Tax=Cronartium quercuum f. sp. fusiforme G11 TaxID=708437 RepID=A0A9P6NAG1_9BASI|nr:hypothetical protein CROQUDRAFT_662378 [Cronartium quercuum f. sp. fusiforme G11]
MHSTTILVQIFTLLVLSISISVSKSHRKCTATLNSAAYGNYWEKANVKWKSPKHATAGIVDATVQGRVNAPTDLGGTTKSHVCYAQIRVNLTDCSLILGDSAKDWDPHTSPIYKSGDTWKFNDTISWRYDCPESLFLEVYENH